MEDDNKPKDSKQYRDELALKNLEELEKLRGEIEGFGEKREEGRTTDKWLTLAKGLLDASANYSAANPYSDRNQVIKSEMPTNIGTQQAMENRQDLLDRMKLAQAQAKDLAWQNIQLRNLEQRDKKLTADTKKKDSKPTAGIQQLDKDFAKDYSKFKLGGGYASLDKSLEQLKGVVKQLKKPDSDLTGNWYEKILPQGTSDYIRRVTDETGQDAKDIVEQVIQQSLRQTLGAQFTEKEAARLIERSYNPALAPEKNAERLEATIKEIETMAREKEKAGKYFEKNKTLDGYKPQGKSVQQPSQSPTKTYTQDMLKRAADKSFGGDVKRAEEYYKSKGFTKR